MRQPLFADKISVEKAICQNSQRVLKQSLTLHWGASDKSEHTAEGCVKTYILAFPCQGRGTTEWWMSSPYVYKKEKIKEKLVLEQKLLIRHGFAAPPSLTREGLDAKAPIPTQIYF